MLRKVQLLLSSLFIVWPIALYILWQTNYLNLLLLTLNLYSLCYLGLACFSLRSNFKNSHLKRAIFKKVLINATSSKQRNLFVYKCYIQYFKLVPQYFATIFVAISIFSLSAIALLASHNSIVLFYPVIVNLFFFIVFATSLLSSTSIVTRIVLTYEKLDQRGLVYTRYVTMAWCVFFIINGTIALVTCLLEDPKWWTYWNSVLSYIFMALFFVIEFIVRYFYRKA